MIQTTLTAQTTQLRLPGSATVAMTLASAVTGPQGLPGTRYDLDALAAADAAAARAAEAGSHAAAALTDKNASAALAGAALASKNAAAASQGVATEKAADATTQASTATTQAGIATSKAGEAVTSAAAALASKNAAAASEVISTSSAQLAAGNVQANLAAIKAQTEAARDAALAGLGAADQSASLAQLVEGIAYNADIVGQLYNEIYKTDLPNSRPLPYVLETLILHISLLFDLVGAAGKWPLDFAETEKVMQALTGACAAALDIGGQAAKQVNGGSVQLAAGTTTEPSLWPAGDRNTGLVFPAADTLALVTAGLEHLRVDAGGNVGIGTNAPSGLLDVNDNRLRVRSAKTPASASASGNAGEVCWDANFVYVATATNQWKRAALATW